MNVFKKGLPNFNVLAKLQFVLSVLTFVYRDLWNLTYISKVNRIRKMYAWTWVVIFFAKVRLISQTFFSSFFSVLEVSNFFANFFFSSFAEHLFLTSDEVRGNGLRHQTRKSEKKMNFHIYKRLCCCCCCC